MTFVPITLVRNNVKENNESKCLYKYASSLWLNLACFICALSETSGLSVITEGKEALLTCVVMSRNSNDTVLWRKMRGDFLTAGMNRVTNDRRFAVLHDEGIHIRVYKHACECICLNVC